MIISNRLIINMYSLGNVFGILARRVMVSMTSFCPWRSICRISSLGGLPNA